MQSPVPLSCRLIADCWKDDRVCRRGELQFLLLLLQSFQFLVKVFLWSSGEAPASHTRRLCFCGSVSLRSLAHPWHTENRSIDWTSRHAGGRACAQCAPPPTMADVGTRKSPPNNSSPRVAQRLRSRIASIARKSSPTLRADDDNARTMSTSAPSNILPNDNRAQKTYPKYMPSIPQLDPEQVHAAEPAFGAPVGGVSMPMSPARSASPPSVFDHTELDQPEQYTEPTTARTGSDEPSYDLKPPPPSTSHDNVEALAVRFFSADHLDLILRDHTLSARFTKFLHQYRPQYAQKLVRYLETKKAITAIEYANAIADHLPTSSGHPPYVAATLDDRFEAKSRRIVEDLVEEALPAYVTHRLVTLTTDTLVKEITGNNAPIMRELIPSLAEVYCVTDPSLPDNPIVYASEGE